MSTPTRYALVRGPEDSISAYLPANYTVVYTTATPSSPFCVIAGEDSNGWTLDGYVLPRLASGLYFGEEIL